MADPIKVIGVEQPLTTATNLSLASLVRMVNASTTEDAVITLKTSSGSVIGSFTLGSTATDFSNECVVKQPTDTIEAAGGTVKAVPLAYR